MSTKNSSIHTKKYKKVLSSIHMVYRLVNSTYNVQELILRLTRLLCQFIDANSSMVCILDQKKKKFCMKATFDNKINVLTTKKKDLATISDDEQRVIHGFVIFEEHLLGMPLVADDIIGAIFVRRKKKEPRFSDFDREILSVAVEQSVIAIRNLQFQEEQQNIILGSIKFIGKLLERYGHEFAVSHAPVFFKIVKSLAEKLNISEKGINNLYYASVLRDAGAIDVPYDILAKAGHLTPEEFKIIQEQPAKSVELIKPVEFLKPVLPIILYHHENYDGTGYPSGLKKEQIPLGARILSVVDAFEAMTRERSYKNRLSVDEAIAELKRNSGTQFDPKVVNAFVGMCKQKKFRNHLSSTKA